MKGLGILCILPPQTPLSWLDYYRDFKNKKNDFGWIQGRFIAEEPIGSHSRLEFGMVGEGELKPCIYARLLFIQCAVIPPPGDYEPHTCCLSHDFDIIDFPMFYRFSIRDQSTLAVEIVEPVERVVLNSSSTFYAENEKNIGYGGGGDALSLNIYRSESMNANQTLRFVFDTAVLKVGSDARSHIEQFFPTLTVHSCLSDLIVCIGPMEVSGIFDHHEKSIDEHHSRFDEALASAG